MNRKERRAAVHQQRKSARKAGFPTPDLPQTTSAEPAVAAAATPLDATLSAAKLAANRANAQHSTGPTSEAGRAASSQNRTTHGLARHNGAFVLLPSEDPSGFAALKASLAEEHEPSTETESILVQSMAESHWLANRAQNLQSSCFDPQTSQITDRQLFSLYLRYQTTHTRAFHKSLNDLLKLRNEKRKVERGFEAQKSQEDKLRLKILEDQIKKQIEDEDRAFKNPEFRADMIRYGTAGLEKTPESDALRAQIRVKWGFAKEESQTAAA